MEPLTRNIFTVFSSRERIAKLIYEICFVLNVITIFVFYGVKNAATVTGILLFISSLVLLLMRGSKKIIIPHVAVWYGFFVLFAALSSTWSEYFGSINLNMLFRMIIILITSMSISFYVERKDDLERIISLFIFSVFVIVCVELAYTPVSEWFVGNMGSNFSKSNSNEIAFWVFCAEIMAFYKAYVKNHRSAYLLVAVFFVFIVMSSSRKALLMGICAPTMMVILSTYKKYYVLRIVLALLIISAVIYFIMTNEDAYQSIGRRIKSMIEFYSDRDRETDSSLYIRKYYVELARQMFSGSPLLGKGFANYAIIIENDYGMMNTYSHNNYWQLLSELGVIGFTLYYSFYLFCIVKLVKRIRKDHSRLALMAFTFMILLIVFEIGIISCYSKYCQMIIAIIFTATYTEIDDGRRYKYKDTVTTDAENNND